MLKAFEYKLEPNKARRYAFARTLDVCRELYNDALQQRKWQRISRYEQSEQLTILKTEVPVYKHVYSQVLQNVLDRLDKSFKNFLHYGFGFPRFKSASRFHSFTYPQSGFSLEGKYLKLAKIGNVKVRLSRPLPEGAKIKTCTIKQTVNGWFAVLLADVPVQPLPACNMKIGIDVGIENYAALSDGTMIQNPRFYENGQAELKRAQRRVARRKKGSHRRAKAVILLRKVQARIAKRRLDWLQKTTTKLIRKYGKIVVENLNVKGLAQGILSKQVNASWGTFFRMLDWKAESAVNREIEYVPCQYTSQDCPRCGNREKKLLSQREHKCSVCGYRTHRDTAAAQSILARIEPSGTNVGEGIPCVA